MGVPPLEFSGETDALLQPFDAKGREFMSYVAQHGTFFDVPAKFLIGEMMRLYPKLCQPGGLRGDMEAKPPRAEHSAFEQSLQLVLELGFHRIGGAQDSAGLQKAERAKRADLGLQQQIRRPMTELLADD